MGRAAFKAVEVRQRAWWVRLLPLPPVIVKNHVVTTDYRIDPPSDPPNLNRLQPQHSQRSIPRRRILGDQTDCETNNRVQAGDIAAISDAVLAGTITYEDSVTPAAAPNAASPRQ